MIFKFSKVAIMAWRRSSDNTSQMVAWACAWEGRGTCGHQRGEHEQERACAMWQTARHLNSTRRASERATTLQQVLLALNLNDKAQHKREPLGGTRNSFRKR